MGVPSGFREFLGKAAMRRIKMETCRRILAVVWIAMIWGSATVGQSDLSGLMKKGTFYVAPRGNDGWSGRLRETNAAGTDGPLATLTAARDAARRLGPDRTRRILLLEGDYFLEAPLVLDARDSGLTIVAAGGAEVVLYGGRKLSGWKKEGKNFYSVTLAGVRERVWDFRAFVVDDGWRLRARLPREGFFSHLSTYEREWDASGKVGAIGRRVPSLMERTTMKYDPADIGPWLEVINAEVRVYHMWDESLLGVIANDTQRHELKFSNPALYAPGMYDMKKYVLWNVREGMTDAGQWYLDRAADKLVYWPLPGEVMSQVEAIAPITESIVRIQGTEDKPARKIALRGITLSATSTPMVTGGFAAGNFDGAISLAFTEDCRLQALEICNVSGYGIKAKRSNFRVEDSHIHHTGAGGICASGRGVVIANNHIHNVGLIYPGGIGIWGGGVDGLISHNEVHDGTYSGIDFGGQGHVIEHNLVYRVVTALHDGGGIRVPGRIHLEDIYPIHSAREVVIRGNFVHDIEGRVHGDTGAWAFFLDSYSENCLLEGNLSINVPWPSQNHLSKRHTIRNNFFIANVNRHAQIELPMSSGHIFERNVFYATGPLAITNPDGQTAVRNNVFFSEKGQVNYHKLREYETVGVYPLDETAGNVIADPLLIDYRLGAVRVAPDSPVTKLGIVPIDVSSAGRR